MPLKEQDGEKTLTEQLEEKEAKSPGVLKGFGIRDREVDLFGEKGHSHDAYSMSNLAWVQLNNGFRLHLGKEGAINIYADFRTPTMYRVYYRSRTEKRQITRHPVELSWAFGLAESEARRVTGGNLTLVDRNARWRQDPATDKQLAILANHGVYRPELTKGAASDLLAQIFARDDT
ncbi:MAG: hypothetical protein AAB116_11410 [Candidatus Poribacteria bacterium]